MTESRYAVLIGNSEFPEDPTLLQPLRCPAKDASGFNAILRSPVYGRFTDTVLLENKRSFEILPVIEETLSRAQKDDLILIYYSGHGKLNAAGALHLATRNTQVRLLQSTSIPVRQIRDLIDVSAAHKFILILDCCYSGRVGEAFLKGGIDDQLSEVSGGNTGRGIYILTASTAIQVAQEKERDDYSLLTKYLLEGIREGKADFDDDGVVAISDLFTYASKSMALESSQMPMKWDLNIQGESFVVSRTGKPPGARRSEQLDQLLYHRRRFRERYILAGITLGGALGGGLFLFFLRVAASIMLAFLGPQEFIVTYLSISFFSGAILGGASALGIALAAHLWQRSEDIDVQTPKLSWVRKFRNRANLGLVLGTLLSCLAYLGLALLGNMHLEKELVGSTLIIGFVIGLGLNLAIYRQPQAGIRMGLVGWIWRIAVAGAAFGLMQTPFALRRLATVSILPWEGQLRNAFAASDYGWLQRLAEHTPLQYVVMTDAFLIGIALTTGITFGLTKAADALADWVATVQPDRE